MFGRNLSLIDQVLFAFGHKLSLMGEVLFVFGRNLSLIGQNTTSKRGGLFHR